VSWNELNLSRLGKSVVLARFLPKDEHFSLISRTPPIVPPKPRVCLPRWSMTASTRNETPPAKLLARILRDQGAIATTMAIRVLSPGRAVLMAAILNVPGALTGTAVATIIGGGIGRDHGGNCQ